MVDRKIQQDVPESSVVPCENLRVSCPWSWPRPGSKKLGPMFLQDPSLLSLPTHSAPFSVVKGQHRGVPALVLTLIVTLK